MYPADLNVVRERGPRPRIPRAGGGDAGQIGSSRNKPRCVTSSVFCMRGDGNGDTLNNPV